MYIVLKPRIEPGLRESFLREATERGLTVVPLPGLEGRALALVGPTAAAEAMAVHAAVEESVADERPYKKVGRGLHPHDTTVPLGQHTLGGEDVLVVAGPCAVETPEQMRAIAHAAHAAGAHGLRGGAFKPRTSPYSFQGHGIEGVRLLAEVAHAEGLPVVTEILDPRDLEAMFAYVDIFQIGARNMQNFALLKAVGGQPKPVLLKRGLSATLEEFLLAAEYLVDSGNERIVLCERGIRTFETATRNTLDLNAVPWLKQRSHLPVVVDPSHATGLRELVAPMSKAALAAGADGLLIEVHPDPSRAWSDGRQSLDPPALTRLMHELRPLVAALGRRLP
jgi:3-deoxy-7-phosphoheptulonate synthase